MNFTINDAYQRVGVRSQTQYLAFDDPHWKSSIPEKESRLGVYCFWEKKVRFLQLDVHHGPPNQETQFGRGLAALKQANKSLGLTWDLPDDFVTANQFVAAVVPREHKLRLVFKVNTDDEAFVKACAARTDPKKNLVVKVTVALLGLKTKPLSLNLEVGPGDAPRVYDGLLALDLGNTSTTLCRLPPGKRSAGDIELLHAGREAVELKKQPEKRPAGDVLAAERKDEDSIIDSAVRLNTVYPQGLKEADHHPAVFQWVIGERVWDGTSSAGVVLGVKRLLADREWERPHPYLVKTRDQATDEEREVLPLKARLPGELLLCRVFQHFREAALRQPTTFAVTYPTTYASRELKQLREVIARSLARTLGEPQTPEALRRHTQLIGLALDEASAAAFFFLYSKYLDKPGGLGRLHYLYRPGLNLLLYDCGGGTTDISLLRASVSPTHLERMKVEVLGRSGVRDFGGDNITKAIFQLLKARIALKVAEVRDLNPRPAFPESKPEELPALLQREEEFWHAHVPTQFNPDVMNRRDQESANLTRELWKRATKLKHVFDDKVKPDTAQEIFPEKETFADAIWRPLFAGLDDSRRHDLIQGLREIRLQRRHIDVLVRKDIKKSIDRCNNLIKTRLPEESGFRQEVHWVILLGNATRYPLIREMLNEHLNVQFFDKRQEFDEKNLKTAVAKGAVLALAATRGGPTARIEFDWTLSERLPFTVGYSSLKGGAPDALYDENTPYDKLPEKSIKIPPPEPASGADPSRWIVAPQQQMVDLYRRWPGEAEYEAYVGFRFKKAIQGSVAVKFDQQRKEFRAFDENNQEGDLIELWSQEIYRSPVQSGKL